MKTLEELGAIIKAESPEYRDLTDHEAGFCATNRFPDRYADYFENEAVRLQRQAQLEIEQATNPFNSTILFYCLGTGLVIVGIWLFDNLNTFEGWNRFSRFVIFLICFVFGLVAFYVGYKNRHKEYEFAQKLIRDRLAHAAQQQALIDLLAKKAIEFEAFMAEKKALIARMKNELAVLNASSLVDLDPLTYTSLRRMAAESEIEIRSKALFYKLDEAHARELKQIELETNREQADLDIQMANIKLLLPFHEADVLNKQLAGLSLELEQAENLRDSEYKIREIKRINDQMKAWGIKIRDRQKRLS